jgi:putative Holliday junction resolvase
MRYLAIDHGTKRTGLAICDAEERVVSPLRVLHGQKGLARQIAQIVEAEGVQAVVVGLPMNMDDSEGPQAEAVKAFSKTLHTHVDIPIYLQDERLSSFGAEEKLDACGLSRNKRRDRLDAVAAAEILQAFLERKRRR